MAKTKERNSKLIFGISDEYGCCNSHVERLGSKLAATIAGMNELILK